MLRCFQLAQLGICRVSPNPMVGAVLVHDGKIIAEGYHRKFGGAHAEVEALNQVLDKDVLEKSTLYVNLEPCCHTGKTPPCTNLIITKGIKHVVLANTDPFPYVNGGGIQQLKAAGIKVESGILEEEGKNVNRRFFTFHEKKRPYVILKWATTKNGYLAPLPVPGAKKAVTWITNSASRLLVHQWRSQEQAILVGQGTVAADNPQLNVRGFPGNNPVRVIIDPNLSLSSDFEVFNEKAKTFVFNLKKNETLKNIQYIKISGVENLIPDVLNVLYGENILSLIVEGGAFTLKHFIESSFWDEARVFTGNKIFSSGINAPNINGLLVETSQISDDQLDIYTNVAVK